MRLPTPPHAPVLPTIALLVALVAANAPDELWYACVALIVACWGLWVVKEAHDALHPRGPFYDRKESLE